MYQENFLNSVLLRTPKSLLFCPILLNCFLVVSKYSNLFIFQSILNTQLTILLSVNGFAEFKQCIIAFFGLFVCLIFKAFQKSIRTHFISIGALIILEKARNSRIKFVIREICVVSLTKDVMSYC